MYGSQIDMMGSIVISSTMVIPLERTMYTLEL